MNKELKILFALLALTFCSPLASGWRSFKIIFTSFPYEFNPELFDVKIQIKNNTNGDTSLDVLLNVLEEIDDVDLKFAIGLESEEGEFDTLVNRSLNFCKFHKQRSAEPIIRMIYEDILKQNNFIKECPLKKGKYSLQEYRLDEEMLPSYVPETNFYLEIKLDKGTKSLFSGRLYGKTDKSKGFNNLKMFSLG